MRMRTEDEIKHTLDLARRFRLTEWLAPLRWALGEDTLPYLDTGENNRIITVMLDGWFNWRIADARQAYHYYSGGMSLCGRWNLVVFGNPENPDDVAAAESKVRSWGSAGVDIRRCRACETKLRELRRSERSYAARAIKQSKTMEVKTCGN
jgi:hypothetical protein